MPIIQVEPKESQFIECLVIDPLKILLEGSLKTDRLLKSFKESNKKADVFHVQSEINPRGFVTKKLGYSLVEWQDNFVCLFDVPSLQLSNLKKLLTENEMLLSKSK